MRLFPRWHTPESVAREIIDGLRDGTVTLDGEEQPLNLSGVIELCVARAAELSSLLATRGVIIFPGGNPTAATLAECQLRGLDGSRYFLELLQRAIAEERWLPPVCCEQSDAPGGWRTSFSSRSPSCAVLPCCLRRAC